MSDDSEKRYHDGILYLQPEIVRGAIDAGVNVDSREYPCSSHPLVTLLVERSYIFGEKLPENLQQTRQNCIQIAGLILGANPDLMKKQNDDRICPLDQIVGASWGVFCDPARLELAAAAIIQTLCMHTKKELIFKTGRAPYEPNYDDLFRWRGFEGDPTGIRKNAMNGIAAVHERVREHLNHPTSGNELFLSVYGTSETMFWIAPFKRPDINSLPCPPAVIRVDAFNEKSNGRIDVLECDDESPKRASYHIRRWSSLA
jgi:hypothetical protein